MRRKRMVKAKAALCAACIALVLCSCGNPFLRDKFDRGKKKGGGDTGGGTIPQVVFNVNGGTGSIAPIPLDGGGANVTLPGASDGITRSGWTLGSWNTTVNGTGTRYALGANYPVSAGGVTLYARWKSDSMAGMEGSGTAADPWIITNDTQLAAIVNDLSGHFKLTANVAVNNWQTIEGSFTGTFDGNGQTITFNGTTQPYVHGDYAEIGLFGINASGAVIKNLKVANSITGTVAGTLGSGNGNHGGGIAGVNSGTIENCVSSVNIDITGSGSGILVGGIAGINIGIIRNCYTAGTVKATGTGEAAFAGGIAGYTNQGSNTMTRCYATGTVTAISTGSYARAGGILPYFANSTISFCVALNPGIIATGSGSSGANRVLIKTSGSSSNCYARSDMTLTLNGTPTTPTSTDAAGNDGADITTTDYQVQGWWSGTVGFAFGTAGPAGTSDAAPWVWGTNQPKLYWE